MNTYEAVVERDEDYSVARQIEVDAATAGDAVIEIAKRYPGAVILLMKRVETDDVTLAAEVVALAKSWAAVRRASVSDAPGEAALWYKQLHDAEQRLADAVELLDK